MAIVFFALAVAAQIYVLQPDPTPRTLMGQAWLPPGEVSSSLLSERNNRGWSTNRQVTFAIFRTESFTKSDVVLIKGSSQAPLLDYFGKKTDGAFDSVTLGTDSLLPARSPIYEIDWSTFTFDRQTGQVSATSRFSLWVVPVLLVMAGLLAVCFAACVSQKGLAVLGWVELLFLGASNVGALYLWQIGREGFIAEASIFAFLTGVVAFWCFLIYWAIATDKNSRVPPDSFQSQVTFSMILMALGVVIEASITVGLFGAYFQFIECLWLASQFAVVATITNILAFLEIKSGN